MVLRYLREFEILQMVISVRIRGAGLHYKIRIFMLKKEVVKAGEQIASDLIDADIDYKMGNTGGNIIKDIST